MRSGTISQSLAIFGSVLCLCLVPPNVAHAQRSYAITLDQAQGLNAGEIAALAQDRTGFIWVGANGGLLRYDGSRFVWWGETTVRSLIREIETGDSGEVIAATEPGEAFAVTPNGLKILAGPFGHAVTQLHSAAYDARGNFWAVIGEQVWLRSPRGTWIAVPVQLFGNERPNRLDRLEHGVGLLTDKSAWVMQDAIHPGKRLMVGSRLAAMRETAPELYWIADHDGTGLWRVDRKSIAAVGRPRGRLMSMTSRDSTLWVSVDRALFSIDADGRQRIQGVKEGIPSGGPLLVDSDGALWLGTFVGILRFPAPDTLQWTEEDGLPSSHAHGLMQTGHDLWVNTWQGVARLDGPDLLAQPKREIDADGDICSDDKGGAWLVSEGQLLHWHDGVYRAVSNKHAFHDVQIAGCTSVPGGKTALATTGGLYFADVDDDRIDKVIIGLHGRVGIDAIWQAHNDDLWLADANEACRLDRDALSEEGPRALNDCAVLPAHTGMNNGIEVSPGVEWLPLSSGLVEIADGRARRLPGNAALPGASIQRLVKAPSGGYWAAGPGALLRIAPCGSCGQGWRPLEAPGIGQGLPGNSAVDVVETAEGDLWIAGNRGVFRVPPAARIQPARPQRLELVTADIDGRRIDTSEAIRLAPDQHRLQLIFSALYYRDPSRLLYRYRLATDAPWSAPTTDAELQLIDQSPGHYGVQMQASLDGRSWTAPAGVVFSVSPPLWQSWPAIIAYALFVVLLLALAYQLRVRHLLSLQRQRLSIARDLHDELGSSLGSIVALTGALRNSGADMSDRSTLADQISSTAQLAGAGLRSLIWTMRDQAVDAATFGREIAEQARRLAPRSPPALQFVLPSNDGEAVFDSKLRRQVLMIVLEAVHNAVRHAGAATISLTLERHGPGWRLAIVDDGCGFELDEPRLGAGLENMQWRASRIGGSVGLRSRPAQGTEVILDFLAARGKYGSKALVTRSLSAERANDDV